MRNEFLYYHMSGRIEGIREGNWKLLVKEPEGKKGSTPPTKPHVMLFNLAEDLGEKHNRAAEKPDIVERLRKKMLERDTAIESGARPVWKKQERKATDVTCVRAAFRLDGILSRSIREQRPHRYAHGWTPTKIALAKRLSVSRTTLDTYLNSPGAPRPVEGSGYDFDAVTEFIAAAGARERTLVKSVPDLRALKAEELTLKCAKLKLSVDRERGLYLLAEDVRRTWLSHLQQARAILLACPAELAPSLCGLSAPEIERRLTERMDAALAALRANPTAS